MKIAYVVAATNYLHPGIQRRMQVTCAQFRNHGHRVDLFPISTNVLGMDINWFSNELPFDPSRYDAVILRSIILGRSMKGKIFQVPTFSERHYPVKHAESVKDYARSMWERNVLNPLDYSAGIFYITSEIASLDGLSKPNLVVGNSALDLSLFEINREPILGRIGMSVGSFASWAGIDLFFELAQKMLDHKFVIAAPSGLRFSNKIKQKCPKNIEFVFAKKYSDYINELKTWSHAIGPLALGRKGLSEAAPLKVRDYISLGIPTFINYLDTNLSFCEDPALKQVSANHRDWQESFFAWVQLSGDLEISLKTKHCIDPRTLEQTKVEFMIKHLKS
jgi:hypothetical protein